MTLMLFSTGFKRFVLRKCNFLNVLERLSEAANSGQFRGVSWNCFGFHGFSGIAWYSMETHWIPWDAMDFYGFLWNSMEVHRNPWNSKVFYEIRWIPMEFHRLPWNSMEFFGIHLHLFYAFQLNSN